MYEEKMKLAVMHFNSLRLEVHLGMRREKSSRRVRVKGRDTLSIKKHWTPAIHDWRNGIMQKSIKLCREKKNEKILERMGAPSTERLLELLGEERNDEAEPDNRDEEEEGEGYGGRGEGDILPLYNVFGLEEEWEEESEEEREEGEKKKESEDEDDKDSATSDSDLSGESDWETAPAPKISKSGRGRGRGRGTRGATVEKRPRAVRKKRGESSD